MAEKPDAQALESSFDEVRRLQSAVHKPMQPNNEKQQMDFFLTLLSESNQFCSKKIVRLQQELVKRDVAHSALTKEKENLSTILISCKANYLEELLEAERKIKKLENDLKEIKLFVAHDVLVASETVSAMIRRNYGDENNNSFIKPTAANMSGRAPDLTMTNELIGVPSTSAAAMEKTDTLSVIVPSVEVEKERSSEDQQPPPAENKSDETPQEVIEITDDEQNVEPMDTGESNLLKRFPCGECSLSFSSMALKYRHEVKVHGDTHEVEQEVERVEKAKKPLKRLKKDKNVKQSRAIRNPDFLQTLMDFCAANSNLVKPPKRTKKTAKNENN